MTVFVLECHHKNDSLPVPRWLTKVTIGCCAKFACWKDYKCLCRTSWDIVYLLIRIAAWSLQPFQLLVYANPTLWPRITTLSYNFCHMSKIGSSNIPRDSKCMSLCRRLILSIAYSILFNSTSISRYLAFRAQISMNLCKIKGLCSAIYTF